MPLVTDNTDFKVKAGIIVSGTATVTSSTGQTGTLQILGGAAIAKNLIVGGPAFFYSTASSTATGVNNSVYVEGGLYAKTHFTAEGPALFKDTVIFSGTATYVLSSNTVYTDNILNLHIPPGGVDTPWTFDDGKDIGIRFHYYENTDTNAAFVFANDTKKFEFYKSGAEGTSTFSNGVYAGIIAGNLTLEDTTATSNTTTGALVVAGGVGIGGSAYIGDGLSAGSVTARNISNTRLAVAGTGGTLYGYADLTYNTGTNIIQGRITTATLALSANNITGGSAGALVYQTATGATNFIGIGTATYVLTSNGTEPYWAPTGASVTANTATNIAGGQIGEIPFQSAPGLTTFSSTLTYKIATGTLEINGGSTASGNIAVSGNILSSGTVFTQYLRVQDSTNSASTDSGAMTVVGGAGIAQDLTVGGKITVGIVTTNSGISLLNGNNLNLSSYTKTGISGNTLINLDSYSGSDYRSSKYFIQAVDGTDIHVTEMSVFHDGIDAFKTEYGFHYNNGPLGTFGAIYTSSNVVITFTPTTATNMTIKIIRWSITP